ncbi:hypothetical protein ACI79C_19655 [Geodermatophilus sp. SYSU D00697]
MDDTVQAGRGRRARWLLLGTAVLQAVSPLVAGFDQGSGADPVVVPPGGFFAVWGVVVLGSVAAALWGLPLHRATRAPWTGVQVPVSVAQVGFVVWLLAAATTPALTLPVFLGMLGVLTWSLWTVLHTPADRLTRVLLGGTLGVYTGWSAAAVWLNAATLLPGDATAVWALLVAGAALTACAGARLFGGQWGFTLAAGWALLGVVVSTSGAGEPGLAALAAGGLAAVAVTALASRRSAAST